MGCAQSFVAQSHWPVRRCGDVVPAGNPGRNWHFYLAPSQNSSEMALAQTVLPATSANSKAIQAEFLLDVSHASFQFVYLMANKGFII